MKAKWVRSAWTFGVVLIALMVIGIPLLTGHGQGSAWEANSWQRMASPGDLSKAHASLEHNCAACHTPIRGIDSAKCILCHANNESLLQRQPTSFHADVSSCRQCHIEHQGRDSRPTLMNHDALARIGLRQLKENRDPESEDRLAEQQLAYWLDMHKGIRSEEPAHLSPREKVLDCLSCHKNDDRHFELFGPDCASCHRTSKWNIPEFRHPSPTSMDCAQCHQAPPSHYMMHFKMISQKVAGRPNAKVEQCYQCHQTTSWPDIKDAGWYKHH